MKFKEFLSEQEELSEQDLILENAFQNLVKFQQFNKSANLKMAQDILKRANNAIKLTNKPAKIIKDAVLTASREVHEFLEKVADFADEIDTDYLDPVLDVFDKMAVALKDKARQLLKSQGFEVNNDRTTRFKNSDYIEIILDKV